MDKQADLRLDPATISRYALGGLVTGGASSALINLLRYVREMREQAKQEDPDETTENTIVLSLPEKKAGIEGPGAAPGSDVTNAHALTSSQPASIRPTKAPSMSSGLGAVQPKQPRRHDGTASFKTAAGWPTLTASALAAVGGGTLGYVLINKLYEMRRQKMLEDELSATQEDYLQSLSKPEKSAMFKEILPFEKQGLGDSFGFLNYPISAAVLLGLLGTGGTAYITKKILDEKLREAEGEGLELPKVRRIIFKTRKSKTPEEKANPELQGTPDDVANVKAALAVMLDVVDDKVRVLEQPYVKEAMAALNETAGSMMKRAQDVDKLMAYLQGAPDLRRMLVRAAMESHPFLKYLKWGYDIPGIQGLMDKQLYSRIGGALGQQPMMQDTARAIGGSEGKTTMASAEKQAIVKHVGGKFLLMSHKGKVLGRHPSHAKAMAQERAIEAHKHGEAKQADLGEGTLSSFLGNALAGENSTNPEDLARAIVEAQQLAKDNPAPRKEDPVVQAAKIQLIAKDPGAKTYLAKNKAKVLAVLRQLATEGKI